MAIAVFGVVMLQHFGATLDRRLGQIQISNDVRQSIDAQRVRLADVKLPPSVNAETREQVEGTVADSFISGFRLIVLISAGLAILGGLSSWLLIGRDKGRRARQ